MLLWIESQLNSLAIGCVLIFLLKWKWNTASSCQVCTKFAGPVLSDFHTQIAGGRRTDSLVALGLKELARVTENDFRLLKGWVTVTIQRCSLILWWLENHTLTGCPGEILPGLLEAGFSGQASTESPMVTLWWLSREASWTWWQQL